MNKHTPVVDTPAVMTYLYYYTAVVIYTVVFYCLLVHVCESLQQRVHQMHTQWQSVVACVV